MRLNGNWSWCCVINVLNGTHIEKYHIGVDGVSSMLLFIAEYLTSKLLMQPKTNFNSFVLKLSFCRNWTVVFSKDTITSSQLGCLLKLWVSSASDGTLTFYELKCNVNE